MTPVGAVSPVFLPLQVHSSLTRRGDSTPAGDCRLPPRNRHCTFSGRVMRLLVVDDSTTMRRIIINTLNKVGYQDCAEAANGREGLERLAESPVDVVITDWNMPEMNG